MPNTATYGRDTLAARLTDAVERSGGKSAVSKASGVPLRSLSGYLSGRNEPPATVLGAIAKACGTSLDWLVGNDDQAISGRNAQSVAVTDSDIVQVPLLAVSASAGHGSLNWDAEIVDRLPFSRALLRRLGVNPERVEFIQARGDSMEPTIKDGANVLIDRSKKDIREDAVYAISIADEVRLKRIRRNFDGSLTLISDNKDFYPEERLPPVDTEHLKVHGRVFWTEKLL